MSTEIIRLLRLSGNFAPVRPASITESVDVEGLRLVGLGLASMSDGIALKASI